MYGSDDYGTSYPSVDAMWEAQLNNKSHFKVNNPIGSLTKWYQSANKYWSNQQTSYNGMLGGYGNLSEIDVNFSQKFLKEVIKMLPNIQFKEALDCGAGIGRITKQILSKIFKTCDLVDQCQNFINKSKQILKDNNIRHFYCKGLQDFNFQHTYDCIWIQWVLTHLNDEDNIAFLIKAKTHLNEGGVIIVKENSSDKGFYVDKDDCTVVRSSMLYRKLFEQAGLKIIKEQIQPDWPTDLFEPLMFALV